MTTSEEDVNRQIDAVADAISDLQRAAALGSTARHCTHETVYLETTVTQTWRGYFEDSADGAAGTDYNGEDTPPTFFPTKNIDEQVVDEVVRCQDCGEELDADVDWGRY